LKNHTVPTVTFNWQLPSLQELHYHEHYHYQYFRFCSDHLFLQRSL